MIHNMSRGIHNDTQIFYEKENESIHLLLIGGIDFLLSNFESCYNNLVYV